MAGRRLWCNRRKGQTDLEGGAQKIEFITFDLGAPSMEGLGSMGVPGQEGNFKVRIAVPHTQLDSYIAK